jgi:hypothetical protein
MHQRRGGVATYQLCPWLIWAVPIYLQAVSGKFVIAQVTTIVMQLRILPLRLAFCLSKALTVLGLTVA